MSNTWSPAATSNEGEVLNLSLAPKLREANLSSSEEGDSSSPQSNDSTKKSIPQHRRRRIAWTEAARLGLMQQVTGRAHCLLANWESVAGLRSVEHGSLMSTIELLYFDCTDLRALLHDTPLPLKDWFCTALNTMVCLPGC